MDLAIRVNVRYAAPPNSQIKDALRLFKSPRWVQSIIRYIMPQLNSVSPAALHVIEDLKKNLVRPDGCAPSCVVCMEGLAHPCVQLPCQHQFHESCIEPWLKMHSTCPTCRDQLPTDAYTNYSVYAINTTIILQQSQARMPTAELLELPASNQIIRAIVNARVRRNVPAVAAAANSLAAPPALTASQDIHIDQATLPSASTTTETTALEISTPVMNASVLQRGTALTATLPPCITEPVVPLLHRNATRRRVREEENAHMLSKRARLEQEAHEERRNVSTAI
ncbi:TPA: hypothetical protein N0F65_007191 [Lagenidium giganteum]|uniref:RING-type domain-containing protein n=1 Tax=Lagenidium giganteum TaxID=4803 RepID=A0AAV2Z9R4_9STRA|nr:TPA: hypothetical protein N0F65_007191 [Lagenidium giganteum]